MSTDAPATPSNREPTPDFVVVYGHSNLLYWWPVWAVGFLLAALTYVEGTHMAFVPAGSTAERQKQVEGYPEPRDVIVAPANGKLPAAAGADTPTQPETRVSSGNNMGVVFVGTLLLVALVSTLTFRGLVSVIVIITLIAAVVILSLLGLWDNILAFLGGLHVRINATGYLAISVPLFLAWLFVVFVYDRQRYVIFDQGQIRLHMEVGDGEKVMDANGVVVEKLRDDVFRHWLIGFGSGDLLVRLGGAASRQIEIDNVLGIGRKLVMIHRLLQEREVTSAVASPMGS